MRDRKAVLAIAGLAVMALAVRHATAGIRIFAHEAGDPSPRRMQAAVDPGLVGVSVLYTWTVDRLR